MSFDVPFIKPVFPSSAVLASDFDQIVTSNWFTNFGPKEREFARGIADRVGSGYEAVTFANATLGLLAVVQTVLGRGDDTKFVIIPSFTFAAGAEAIVWSGYKPVLIDIDRLSLQPSLEDARSLLESDDGSIAGILLCNTFGIGNDEVGQWEELARHHDVPLIIDSAAGFGSLYADGSAVGSRGRAEVLSFHATKPFAIGEGGAVVTKDADLAAELKSFQNFGFRGTSGATNLGLNGKLQEINAVIGLRQLEVFDQTIRQRQSVFRSYAAALSSAAVSIPDRLASSSVCFLSVLFDDAPARDTARDALTAARVEVRTYYQPALHLQPYFGGTRRANDLANTDAVARTILSLPVHQEMDPAVIEHISGIIRDVAGERA
jgi:dTDP-4-amino-4,6-dideoxygalactose transaminase